MGPKYQDKNGPSPDAPGQDRGLNWGLVMEHGRRSKAMGYKRWYVVDALEANLTNHHHHLRAASEEEVERRARKRYPGAVVLAYLEESCRQNLSPYSRSRPVP
jgi:hypothetical protein